MSPKSTRQQRRAEPIATEIATELEAHERECAIRYENIEKRLDAGSERFKRLENMIWGLYGLLITTAFIGEVLG